MDPLKSDSDSIDHDIAIYGTPIIDLPKNLPQSTIVWSIPVENVTHQDMANKAAMLYQKYIKLGCELELNISFRLRKEMTRKWDKLMEMDEIQLYAFFDNVLESMIKLMKDSYTRFRMTKGFVVYEREFVKRRDSLKGRDSIAEKIKKRFSKFIVSLKGLFYRCCLLIYSSFINDDIYIFDTEYNDLVNCV